MPVRRQEGGRRWFVKCAARVALKLVQFMLQSALFASLTAPASQ